MIQVISQDCDILSALCKESHKWGMYISFDPDLCRDGCWEELYGAAPYLKNRIHGDLKNHGAIANIIMNGYGYFLFDSKEECMEYYYNTVGDDGPTKTNSYKGPFKVYALTCNANGELQTENT